MTNTKTKSPIRIEAEILDPDNIDKDAPKVCIMDGDCDNCIDKARCYGGESGRES